MKQNIYSILDIDQQHFADIEVCVNNVYEKLVHLKVCKSPGSHELATSQDIKRNCRSCMYSLSIIFH